MNFSDIFKKSFLEGWSSTEVGTVSAFAAIAVTALLALYIFFAYRVITRKTFYSKTFNISLVGVAMITAAIIITIQSSIVVSLGMVGALSIVRFRTAIKEPMDLMFLFWSISTGIICGAGLAEFAVILALLLTVVVLVLNYLPVAKSPMILIVNAVDIECENEISQIVQKYCKHPKIKARNMTSSTLDLTYELRVVDSAELVKEITKLKGVESATLLQHDGEATF